MGVGRWGACRRATSPASETFPPLRPLAVSLVRRVYGRGGLGPLPACPYSYRLNGRFIYTGFSDLPIFKKGYYFVRVHAPKF
jgi:hypothetical protein